jgi:triosephosphate isomerase
VLIVGNWKMNGLAKDLEEARSVARALVDHPSDAKIVICPPATLVAQMAKSLRGGVAVGGQNCHEQAGGAFTGEVSAAMLADAGARYVILGHSERRAAFGETNRQVAAKVVAAIGAGLEPIICVGETLAERDAGQTLHVLRRQVAGSTPDELIGQRFAIAYEPVWAVGTDHTPGPSDIVAAHTAIRAVLAARFGAYGSRAPILYGGSVNATDARQIIELDGVSGLLVGRASVRVEDFLPLIRAVDGLADPVGDGQTAP